LNKKSEFHCYFLKEKDHNLQIKFMESITMDLNDIGVFVRVAERGSLTRAADALNLPVSAVSLRLARLEKQLEVRLVERTTRTMRLTDAGEKYLRHVAAAFREIEAGKAVLGAMSHGVVGRIRMTAPPLMAATILPAVIAEFLKKYPQVDIDMDVTGRFVDLIEDGIDLALRVAEPPDTRLIAKRIGATAGRFYASPRLFEHKMRPTRPSELADWPLLAIASDAALLNWLLRSGKKSEAVSFRPRLAATDHQIILEAMHAGIGIANLPMFLGDPLVKAGKAEAVLPDWTAREVPLYLIYPSHKSVSLALRALLDHLSLSLTQFFPLQRRDKSRAPAKLIKG
jgi:DNA-binding transcriptional LysR family regulator